MSSVGTRAPGASSAAASIPTSASRLATSSCSAARSSAIPRTHDAAVSSRFIVAPRALAPRGQSFGRLGQWQVMPSPLGCRVYRSALEDATMTSKNPSSLVDLLPDAARRHADKVAFRCFGAALTYGDVDRLARAFAAHLQVRLGVRKGDRVAVMLPNVPAFPVATLGLLRTGAVQVNINPQYTPREL